MANAASIGNGGHAIVSGGGRDISAALSSGGQLIGRGSVYRALESAGQARKSLS